MKKLFYGLTLLLTLLIAAMIVVPKLIDVNNYKPMIISLVKERTGRDLTINGPIQLQAFPTLALNVSDIALSNVEESPNATMVEAKEVSFRLAMVPLLRDKEIKILKLSLISPVVHLEVDKKGKKNWDILPKDANEQAKDTSSSGFDIKKGFALSAFTIKDGVLTYTNEKDQTSHDVKDLNLSLGLSGMDQPLAATIEAMVDGHKLDTQIDIANLQAFMDGTETQFNLNLTTSTLRSSLAGTFALKNNKLQGVGTTQVTIDDVKALQEAFKKEPSSPVSKVSLQSSLALSDQEIKLSGIALKADAMALSGNISMFTGEKKPRIIGNIAGDHLDLTPFMGDQKPKGEAAQTAPSGWSDKPYDFSGFNNINADLHITANSMVIPPLTLGKSDLNLILTDGVLRTVIKQMDLYQGSLTGTAVLDASKPGIKISKDITMTNIQLEPFLKDLAKMDSVSGQATTHLSITAYGKTEREVIAHLNGKGKVDIRDGSVKRVNLASMLRNVSTAFTNAGSTQSNEKTDFSDLHASYTITNGIVSNQDLLMRAALMTVGGQGTADLPNKTLNYRLTPKVVGTLKGQDRSAAVAEEKGLMIPIIIDGPFSHLRYRPDVGSVVKDLFSDPTQTKTKLKDLEKGVRGIRDSLLGEITGKPANTDTGTGTAAPSALPSEATSPITPESSTQPINPTPQAPSPTEPVGQPIQRAPQPAPIMQPQDVEGLINKLMQ